MYIYLTLLLLCNGYDQCMLSFASFSAKVKLNSNIMTSQPLTLCKKQTKNQQKYQ